MKKIILILLSFTLTNLNAKLVKFSVDMSNETVNALGVHVSGDFQKLAGYSDDWSSTETLLNKEGSTNIYSIIVNIPANQKYEYKFLNGDQFYDVEFVPEESRVGYEFNDNRWFYLDSLKNDTTDLGSVIYGGNAPQNLFLYRFKVNMEREKVSAKGVHLIGNFSNFDPKNNYMYSFDGYTYEKIIYFNNSTFEYKFINGNASDKSETVPSGCKNTNGNRTFSITDHHVMEAICFSECQVCLTDVNDLNLKEVFMYPNPVNDILNIVLENNAEYFITISNINGEILLSNELANQTMFQLHTGFFKNGTYFIALSNKTNKISSISKLIINK